MASSTSLKDLSKAINSFITDPKLPLPESLVSTVDSYLEKHDNSDDSSSDRLHEELQSIYDKHVPGNANATGPWMGILRRLQPALQTPEKVLFWFDACLQLLEDGTPREKLVVDEMVQAMMNTVQIANLVHDNEDSEGNPIIDRLFSVWLNKFHPAVTAGKTSAENNEQLLRETLMRFGKSRLKEFFITIDKFFVMKQYRKAVLRFFSDYIQAQPPHLYQVSETPFFEHLLMSLQRDTSTTVVSAALTALIMLLPHMPSALVPHLPTLFNVYARLLFWDRERTGAEDMMASEQTSSETNGDWKTCVYDPTTEGLFVGHLSQYYTMLYGLYPINFMDYIRKPQRYLRHANIANAEEIEVQPTEIRQQSEHFRRSHLLHRNFYTLTIESEKTDFSRWIKCDAAEVVTECIGLCTTEEVDTAADNISVSMHDARVAEASQPLSRKKSETLLLSSSLSKVDSWRNAQMSSLDPAAPPSTLARRPSQSSQPSSREVSRQHAENAAQLTKSPSNSQLQDLIKSNKAIKSGLHQSLANDSVASLTLSHADSTQDRSMPPPAVPHSTDSPVPTSDFGAQISYLQNQVLLLQTELRFERYLKQQHITHIGDLRRRHVSEAATEAETQDLIMTSRNLKTRYEEAKKAEMQVRKESERSRALVKNREADFYTKMKNLRVESKATHSELEKTREELQATKDECAKLRNMVCDAEVRELNWKQDTQIIEIHGAEVERLKQENSRLTLVEKDHQARELEREDIVNFAAEATSKAEELELKLEAQVAEVQRTRSLFQSQVAALQEQLSETQEERSRPNANANLAVESALAASRAKQAELQKQNDLLLRKYKVLQSSLLDMSSAAPLPAEPNNTRGQAIESPANKPTSPTTARPRPFRSSTGQGSRHEGEMVTSPVDGRPGVAMSGGTHQPISPQRKDSVATQPSRSPEQRYFGGLSSRIRKESSDKAKDDGSGGSVSGKAKKEKKSGLRGIRGFVG